MPGISRPLVTVCMPVYNSARYLAEAIESVLGQTCGDFELLLIDDGSTDGSAQIAAQYAARDSRVVLRVNGSNLGMVRNWNLCIEQARGRYLKYLFGDDVLRRDALERMVEVMERDPQVSLAASARTIIDERSRPLEEMVHFEAGSYDGPGVIMRCIREQRNLVGEPSAVLFRVSDAGAGFEERYRQVVDLEMWFRLLEKGRLAYLDEPHCSFRRHPEQQTCKNEKNFLNFSEMFELSTCYVKRPYSGFGRWGAHWFLFETYYTFWKVHGRRLEARELAREVIHSQYGRANFLGMMLLYKLYNPCRKLGRMLQPRI